MSNTDTLESNCEQAIEKFAEALLKEGLSWVEIRAEICGLIRTF